MRIKYPLTIKKKINEMKTGIRLTHIDKMISKHYTDIWDCCCDHGLLGMTLLKRKAADKLHFVDIAQPLITKLATQLTVHFSHTESSERWQVYCLDVAKLPLFPKEHGKVTPGQGESPPLIIIAGVGGDLLITLVEKIIAANPKQTLEFILCPVHHNYKVRQGLIAQNFSLINEMLVTENQRFYEIIHVTTTSSFAEHNTEISSVGASMWDFSREDDQKYLKKTLSHYQRMLNNPDINASQIVAEYQALSVNHSKSTG